MNKLEEYKGLLSMTYDEAVNYLYQKYGFAQDDYYRENSYKRFMQKKIKSDVRMISWTRFGRI